MIGFGYLTIKKYFVVEIKLERVHFWGIKIRSENSLKCAGIRKTNDNLGGCCKSPVDSR